MKKFVQLLFLLAITNLFAQNTRFQEWSSIAENDPSLQPEFGEVQKTPEQIEQDKQFVEAVLKEYNGDKQAAGKKMTALGFQYFNERGDFLTAMRRFNQAFLIDPTNADIYYGYGTIFFNLGEMERAREQYDKGLEFNPEHSEILTEYGTTYLGDFYQKLQTEMEVTDASLEQAEKYLLKSYEIDPENSNTIYKLAIVNMYLTQCEAAKTYFKLAKEMDNLNITEAFEKELLTKCRD